MEACLEELGRNAPLRLLIDIQREEDVPNGWNLTRFLAVLGQEPFQSERTSVERVNRRLKVFWGLDDGNAVMIVHLAFATQLAEKQQNQGTFAKMKV